MYPPLKINGINKEQMVWEIKIKNIICKSVI